MNNIKQSNIHFILISLLIAMILLLSACVKTASEILPCKEICEKNMASVDDCKRNLVLAIDHKTEPAFKNVSRLIGMNVTTYEKIIQMPEADVYCKYTYILPKTTN